MPLCNLFCLTWPSSLVPHAVSLHITSILPLAIWCEIIVIVQLERELAYIGKVVIVNNDEVYDLRLVYKLLHVFLFPLNWNHDGGHGGVVVDVRGH